ncbi:MAG TPA: CRISPR-associated endonuclease Cas3'', partial [Pirellulales bacterium]|nr:CRISPR-associated endonuclease Cas3'' [Pirellulales bacterium]
MRVLVEQTHIETVRWLDRLGMLAAQVTWEDAESRNNLVDYDPDPDDQRPADGWAAENGDTGHRIAVHLLMGGEDKTDWVLYPERDAILIGTQDMLLSRALNRGYAASRARWPMEFGLLNNDCLWVFDEVQLMGSALATSAQLDSFRNGGKQHDGFGRYGTCKSLWMSATIQPDWLETVDHALPAEAPFGLTKEEWHDEASDLAKRLWATKTLKAARNRLEKKPALLAEEIAESHSAANGDEGKTMTLVVVNTVERAARLFVAIEKMNAKRKLAADLLLIHSRFRPPERKQIVEKLLSDRPPKGRIVVSTQVVEAGVDISAKLLFTELAPWASLVQRFGRCNRKGEIEGAEVHWIDVADDDYAPYETAELENARQLLQGIGESPGTNVGSASLPDVELPYRPLHVLRRKDLIDLFDTTPDLAGNDIDISRFLRDGDDHDVQVFWRDVAETVSPDDIDEKPGRREELCPVGVGNFREFITKANNQVWRWDFLDERWRRATYDMVFPGQVFLVSSSAGGYSMELGWTGDADDAPVTPLASETIKEERSTESEALSQTRGCWQSIAEHTDEVCGELERVLDELGGEAPRAAVTIAARWHDWGKAHPSFEAKLRHTARMSGPGRAIRQRAGQFIAKAPSHAWLRPHELGTVIDSEADQRRRHFRHELASALAVLQLPSECIPDALRDLVAYLVAAHHGKVRLSIRSLPGEQRPPSINGEPPRFARGVWEGDTLPRTDLGGGIWTSEIKLKLEPMVLGCGADGSRSWAARMLSLRDSFGLFRLAFLESLLRAADWRASGNADRRGETR